MDKRRHQKLSGGTEQLIDNRFRLAVAKDLARIYADVLHDPIPPDLQKLLRRLETNSRNGHPSL